jgi:hypothetical protein
MAYNEFINNPNINKVKINTFVLKYLKIIIINAIRIDKNINNGIKSHESNSNGELIKLLVN